MEKEGKGGKEIIVQLIGWAVSSLECDMCVRVVCDVGIFCQSCMTGFGC